MTVYPSKAKTGRSARGCQCAGAATIKVPALGQVIIRWVDACHVEHRHRPADIDAGDFGENCPARKFGRYDNMKHFPGLYWCATTAKLVGFESWGERAWALMMDFDPAVTAIASQPFQLIGRDQSGLWHHIPDYWAARAGRPPLVLDVRPEARSDRDSFLRLVGHTRELCGRLGWDYRLVHEVDPMLQANIDFLSAYRRPLTDPLGLRPQILAAAAAGPATIATLCAAVGEPVVVLPQLFRLCWQHRLRWDLTSHLRFYSTEVFPVTGRRDLGSIP
jgi:hypothetical protein